MCSRLIVTLPPARSHEPIRSTTTSLSVNLIGPCNRGGLLLSVKQPDHYTGEPRDGA